MALGPTASKTTYRTYRTPEASRMHGPWGSAPCCSAGATAVGPRCTFEVQGVSTWLKPVSDKVNWTAETLIHVSIYQGATFGVTLF